MSSIMSNASATKGWVTSNYDKDYHHTAVNPGHARICGDHICASFEHYVKNLLWDMKKQNQTDHFIK